MDEALLKQAGFADAQAYAQWGALHRRYVSGELLSAEEQAAYQAGCDQLDATEKIEGDIPRLRELRDKVLEAREISRKLWEREIAADAEIAELEARLSPRSRRLLGIEN